MPRGFNRYDEAAIQKRLWSPSVLQPKLWLDSSDLSTITISTGVSEWRDKSGNQLNAIQTNTARQPTLVPNGFNGRPTLRFDGIDDFLLVNTPAATFNFLHNGDQSSVSFVANMGALGADPNVAYSMLSTSVASAEVGISIFYEDRTLVTGNNALRVFGTRGVVNDPTINSVSSNVYTPGVPSITTLRIDADNSTAAQRAVGNVNGGSDLAANTLTATPTTANATNQLTLGIAVFSGSSFNSPLLGDYSELVIISNNTPKLELQNLEGYFAWKWGLTTNLPASHPFANRPPLIGD
jgi:hypothetical protein